MSDILNQIPQLILNRKKQQKKESEIALDNDIFLGLDNLENIDQKFKIYSESQRRNSFVSSPNYNRSLSINKIHNLNSKQIIQNPDSNRTGISNSQPRDMKLTSLKFINEQKQDNQKPSIHIQTPNIQQSQQQARSDQVNRLNHGSMNIIQNDKCASDKNQPVFMINKKRNSFSSHAASNYKSQTSLAFNQANNIPTNQKENHDKQPKNLTFTNEVQKYNNVVAKSSLNIPQKEKQETQATEQSLNYSKQKLSIKDLATFQRNLMINRSIQALKKNLIEMNGDNALNSSRSQKDQSNNSSQFANLATLIYDIITSTNSLGNFMKNPFAISIPNVEKVFNQFNIDKKKLANLKTMQEKEEYIVTSIYTQSIEQLKQMIEKINRKTDEFVEIDEKEQEKGKHKKNMNELFSWIQIPGSYDTLKNKVKYSLVEVLYGHNNLQQLQELQQKNEEYNNTVKALKEGMTQKHLSTLGEFQENQQQFSDTLNYFGSMTSNKKIRSVHLKIEDDLNRTSQSLLKVEQRKLTTISGQSLGSSKYQKTDSSNNNKPQQLASPKFIPKNLSEQVQNFDDQQFKDADVILKEKLNNFQWDYQNERTFQSYKKSAKKTFVGLDSMNRWQSIGMQPIIQKLGLEEKLDLYREQLQEKYQRGENLKESEKIFIINTSQLLISNIDKEYFQGMLDFICEEDILKLEQIIAENIILKYETIAQYLKNQRNQYLKEKAEASANQIEKSNVTNIYNKIKDEKKAISRQKEFMDSVEKIKRRLERKFESIQFYEQLRKNLYVKHFVNQLKKAIAYKELGQKKFVKEESYYKNFAKRNYPQKKDKVLFTINDKEEETPITTKQSQKIYHPTSKLLLGLNSLAKIEEAQKSGRNRNYLIDMPPKQQKQLEMQRATYEQFTNRLQDSKKLESFQANFTEYYSNGPIDSRDLKNKIAQLEKKKDLTADGSQQEIKLKKPHLWITKQIEEKCAVIIQKWVRRFLQQKKYNEQLQQIKDQQEKKMFSILKQWKDSKELMNFIKNHTLQVARQKKLALNKNQIKNATLQTQSQPNSPRSNNSSVSMANNQNVKEKYKEKLGGNVFAKGHRKQVSEHTLNQINQNGNQHLDRSDSISSINSKQSKHSYLGSATSTRIGGTVTHDFSIYGLHGYNATKKKSIKSTDDSIHQISHGRSISDFQSPKSALFYSKQFFPSSNAMMSNYLGESQHNNLTVKELKEQQIDEDVNMENEQLQCDEQFKDNKQMLQQQLLDQQKNIPLQLQRKVSFTANQLKQQIKKIKEGVKDFSKKREELLLKQKKLFYAVKQGNIQIIKNSGFIYYPHDVNTLDEKGNCPLYYATKRGNEELIDFLLRQGADVNIRCQEGNTPVHLAFQLGNEKVIMSFLDKEGDLNSINDIGQTPLAFAPIKLLKLIGLDKGITNIEPQKIGQRIDFDNNKIFVETHNIIDTSNHVREANSNITIVKKRKEKQAHEEIPEKDLYFQFIPTNSTLDINNYDKFAKGIKILQKSPRTGDMFHQIQSFVEPQKRQQKNEENECYLEFSPKNELSQAQKQAE